MPWIVNHKHKIEEKSTKSSRSSSKVVGLGPAHLWEFPTLTKTVGTIERTWDVGRMDGWMDGWMDGRMDRWSETNIPIYFAGYKQGKSEGFESCDRPTVGKCPIWVKIGDVLYRVTLKFDGWPWKTIGHLSFAVSSFVQHFIAIGEFKLELQSGNTQFGSNLMIFRAVWPWNLTDDLQKQ